MRLTVVQRMELASLSKYDGVRPEDGDDGEERLADPGHGHGRR